MANSSILLVGCFIIIFFNVVVPASSATHSIDWSLGTDYYSLATAKNFGVGDTMVFNYGAGHTVDEVSESDYKRCALGNAITSDSSGNTTIVLKTTGPHYFICSIPGHCMSGMKLSVTVGAANSSAGGGDSFPAKTTPPALEGGKAASSTAMLKPLETLVATCVVALLYGFTFS